VSGVRWRHPFHGLLLFFFPGRAVIVTEGELTLLFGFATEAGAISALLLVLLFGPPFWGWGAGKGDSLSSSSSPEFSLALSSSSSDLSDGLVSLDESLDSEGFRANLMA
jgi:hypothetical protein